MTTDLSLDMEIREVTGKKVKRLRQEGLLPATIYGKDFSPLTVQLDSRAFSTVYQQSGRTALIKLTIPGMKKRPSAFVQDIQRHPVKRDILHADFRVVDLTVEINAEVPVALVGTSPLVERGDAVINHGHSTVEIRALPEKVPQHLELDISVLDSLDKSIHVGDLPPHDDYVVNTAPETLLVSLSQVRAAVAAADEEAEEEPTAAEPALIRKEREEEE